MAGKTLELDPDNAAALRVLHDVYRERGDQAKAAEALERLKSVEGGGTEAAIRLYNEGVEATRQNDLEGARSRFEEALAADPELAPAHGALARIYYAQEHWDQAIAAAEKAYQLDPGQAGALKYAYEGYRKKGDTEQARRVFAVMSEADPEGTAGSLFEAGIAMFNAGDMAGAQQALEQALEADPDLPKAHYTLGLSYANTGDNAKAIEHLKRFLELAPDDPDAGTAKEMLDYLS
jgi:tetratricopeptide (TPR) repeat protein